DRRRDKCYRPGGRHVGELARRELGRPSVGHRNEFASSAEQQGRIYRTILCLGRRDSRAVLCVAVVREHGWTGEWTLIRGCGLRQLRQGRRALRDGWRI